MGTMSKAEMYAFIIKNHKMAVKKTADILGVKVSWVDETKEFLRKEGRIPRQKERRKEILKQLDEKNSDNKSAPEDTVMLKGQPSSPSKKAVKKNGVEAGVPDNFFRHVLVIRKDQFQDLKDLAFYKRWKLRDAIENIFAEWINNNSEDLKKARELTLNTKILKKN
jgi:hypothetical protein